MQAFPVALLLLALHGVQGSLDGGDATRATEVQLSKRAYYTHPADFGNLDFGTGHPPPVFDGQAFHSSQGHQSDDIQRPRSNRPYPRASAATIDPQYYDIQPSGYVNPALQTHPMVDSQRLQQQLQQQQQYYKYMEMMGQIQDLNARMHASFNPSGPYHTEKLDGFSVSFGSDGQGDSDSGNVGQATGARRMPPSVNVRMSDEPVTDTQDHNTAATAAAPVTRAIPGEGPTYYPGRYGYSQNQTPTAPPVVVRYQAPLPTSILARTRRMSNRLMRSKSSGQLDISSQAGSIETRFGRLSMKQRVTEEDQVIIRKSNSFIEAVWKRTGEPKNDGVDESKIFEIHGQHIGKSQLKAVVGTTQDQQAVVLALNYQTWTPSSHILKTVTKSLESEGQQWPPLWTGSRVYPRYLDKARDIAHALDATFFGAIMQSPAGAQVYIVGQGKAAGVAQILAAMTLLKHMELIGRRTINVVLEFAPLVGNAAFRAIYNQLGVKTLRVYHRQTIFNVGPTAGAGYVPVGTEVFFAFKSGPPVYCPEDLDTLFPDPDCSTWRL